MEPWLRGGRLESGAVVRAILHALDQAEEDVLRWTAELSNEQVEARLLGLPSVGFQMRHIVRSLDRLLTYAEGGALTEDQLASLRSESDVSEEVRSEFIAGIASARARVSAFEGFDPEAERFVGRDRLRVSLGGLLVHLAEHTQRHVGQLITTAKVVTAS